jgi:hypothetical protein
VLVGQQLDTVALERGDDPVPYLTADMPVAAFIGNVQLTADLEAMHRAHGDTASASSATVSSAKGRAVVSWRPSKVDMVLIRNFTGLQHNTWVLPHNPK